MSTDASPIVITEADLDCAADADAVLMLIDVYSRDPMGRGRPLDDDVRDRLIDGLRAHPTTVILLARDAADRPLGAAVCFLGFSTFAARPLLNIHDLTVHPDARGRGVGRALITAAAAAIRRRGGVRVTLEVNDANPRARALYESLGFTTDTAYMTLDVD